MVDIILEVFEEESEDVKNYRFTEKIPFPEAILLKSSSATSRIYRLPLSNIDEYHNNFHKLLLLKQVKNMISDKEFNEHCDSETIILNSEESSPMEPTILLDCANDIQLLIKDFLITILYLSTDNKKIFKLRHVEVMLENKKPRTLNLIINQLKQSCNVKIEFYDEDDCKEAKKIIENKRKESKAKEIKFIKNFLARQDMKNILLT